MCSNIFGKELTKDAFVEHPKGFWFKGQDTSVEVNRSTTIVHFKGIKKKKKKKNRSWEHTRNFIFAIIWYQNFGKIFPQNRKKLVKFTLEKHISSQGFPKFWLVWFKPYHMGNLKIALSCSLFLYMTFTCKAKEAVWLRILFRKLQMLKIPHKCTVAIRVQLNTATHRVCCAQSCEADLICAQELPRACYLTGMWQ
jgi:hypothetical protein